MKRLTITVLTILLNVSCLAQPKTILPGNTNLIEVLWYHTGLDQDGQPEQLLIFNVWVDSVLMRQKGVNVQEMAAGQLNAFSVDIYKSELPDSFVTWITVEDASGNTASSDSLVVVFRSEPIPPVFGKVTWDHARMQGFCKGPNLVSDEEQTVRLISKQGWDLQDKGRLEIPLAMPTGTYSIRIIGSETGAPCMLVLELGMRRKIWKWDEQPYVAGQKVNIWRECQVDLDVLEGHHVLRIYPDGLTSALRSVVVEQLGVDGVAPESVSDFIWRRKG